jgi:WD40 repeat protein
LSSKKGLISSIDLAKGFGDTLLALGSYDGNVYFMDTKMNSKSNSHMSIKIESGVNQVFFGSSEASKPSNQLFVGARHDPNIYLYDLR